MRLEKDSLGELEVPDEAYYGVQTVRCSGNYKIGNHTYNEFPEVIRAMAEIKKACAITNSEIGALNHVKAEAICKAADELIAGKFAGHFPVNVWRSQGTGVNMNVNEVIANRANEILTGKRAYDQVHPNTHVNMCQSSNDVFPTAEAIVLYRLIDPLVASAKEIEKTLEVKARDFKSVVRLGRTGLQDALPMTWGQVFAGWLRSVQRAREQLESLKEVFSYGVLGGTAVGTGMGCLPGFRGKVNKHLSDVLGYEVKAYDDLVDGMMAIDDLIACHGQVVALSAQVWKLARDLRVMASGPNSGLREVYFEVKNPENALNPQRFASCSLESVITACNQVSANNSSILFGLKNGWLDLGACSSIPLRAMINSATMLKEAMRILTEEVLPSMRVNSRLCQDMAESSVSNTTMISTIFGYEIGSQVAHLALEENISPREAAKKLKILPDEVIDELFDVSNLTHPENMEALFEKYKDFRKL